MAGADAARQQIERFREDAPRTCRCGAAACAGGRSAGCRARPRSRAPPPTIIARTERQPATRRRRRTRASMRMTALMRDRRARLLEPPLERTSLSAPAVATRSMFGIGPTTSSSRSDASPTAAHSAPRDAVDFLQPVLDRLLAADLRSAGDQQEEADERRGRRRRRRAGR